MTTSEGNILIAQFDGRVKDTDSPWWRGFDFMVHGESSCHEECLRYEESWDWLMPVVEKIERYSDIEVGKHFRQVGCFDIDYSDQYPSRTTSVRISICTKLNGSESKFHTIKTKHTRKIEAVWQACLDFIQWHNSTLSKTTNINL